METGNLIFFSNFIWDPDRNFFVVPYIEHPITWYGVLFAFGFLVGYFLIRKIFSRFLSDSKMESTETQLAAIKLSDRLTFLVVVATVIGARLGHVFFYGWPYYRQNPMDIFKIWEGGLASHGAALGILLGLVIFVFWNRSEYPRLTFLTVLDIVVIPTAFAGGAIRIGNFINQEITGIPTNMPWAVTFMHPLDGTAGIAVHPVQLYESFFYFLVFFFLLYLWKKGKRLGMGLFSGWFFTLVFLFRFFIEFLKAPQSELMDAHSSLDMGQILSFPFIILGISLLIFYFFKKKRRQKPI